MFSKITNAVPAEAAANPVPIVQSVSSGRALLIVLSVMICACTVRLLTYDRYLPYVDYIDEATYVALADEIRGFSDQTALREQYGLLAPLYVYTNVVVQTIHDMLKTNPWHVPGEYFYSLRLLSVFFGVCTAFTIAWIGWQLGGLGAAAVGGIIWALSPIVVDLNSLAIPDPMLYLVQSHRR
jgi:4-amino-4-deoxy-L-arabinose transferase-like glycosyltransferase